jgi:type VI secretion system secreted protein VgrG
VLQDNTGHSGSIPRIGWEVLVHFLEGDPDRPVVVGRVYNPLDPPHLFLPINKTRSVIKSLTSPRQPKRDDSGTNELMFEDLQGLEHIQYHAEKDQNVVVGRNKTETVLLNQSSAIDRDERVGVGQNQLVNVGTHQVTTVKRDQSHTVGANRKVRVDQSDQENVGGNRSMTVGAMHFRRIGTDDTAAAQQKNTEMVGGVILEASMKDNTNTGTRLSTLAVGGAHVELAKQDKNEGVGKLRAETIGGAVMVKADGEIGMRANKKRATKVGGPLRVKAHKEMTLVGREKLHSESLTGKYTAPDGVMLKVGDTEVVLKDGTLSVHAKTDIQLTVTGTNDQGASKGIQAK